MPIIAAIILVITLIFVIWKPKGLHVGWSAGAGAVLSMLAGIVSLSDVAAVVGIIWNATLAFIAAVLISLVLDGIGFFEWAALVVARQARGSGKNMFVLGVLLGSVVTAFFNNDGAALMLTPIILMMVRSLGLGDRAAIAFAMAGGFIADTTSLPLIISNLTNIISADFFGIGFAEYAAYMVVPDLFSLTASLAVLLFVFRRFIPRTYDLASLKQPREAIRDVKLFYLSWAVLGMLFAAYLLSSLFGVPVSLIAGAAAILLLVAARNSGAVRPLKLVREAPWGIIVFSVGMFVVVYGLQNAGITAMLGWLMQRMAAFTPQHWERDLWPLFFPP